MTEFRLVGEAGPEFLTRRSELRKVHLVLAALAFLNLAVWGGRQFIA